MKGNSIIHIKTIKLDRNATLINEYRFSPHELTSTCNKFTPHLQDLKTLRQIIDSPLRETAALILVTGFDIVLPCLYFAHNCIKHTHSEAILSIQ